MNFSRDSRRTVFKSVHDLPTPAAVVHLSQLQRNASRMIERAQRLGVRLRPHIKTHKTLEGALLQTEEPDRPVTVSTLAEASMLAAAGFEDMTWAYPISPVSMKEAVDLARVVRNFRVITDDERVVEQLQEAASGVSLGVMMEVDVGGHRGGVDPDSERAIRVAQAIDKASNLRFVGLLGHEGQAYHLQGAESMRRVATEATERMQDLVARLQHEGIGVREVSLGSTPTAIHAERLPGVTEIRPGNYLFFDWMQVQLGTCEPKDIAFGVYTSVVGVYPERDSFVIDAGALALSMDPGVSDGDGWGFGRIVSINGSNISSELTVGHLSQEHGVVHWTDHDALRNLRVGDRVLVHPNHSCLAAALFDRYFVELGGEIVDSWRPVRGWKVTRKTTH